MFSKLFEAAKDIFKPADDAEVKRRNKIRPPKKYGWYTFTITMRGIGASPEEAWEDCLDGFTQDPGPAPEVDSFEPEDDEEPNTRELL
jgi:hypothetical protein